MSNFFIAMMKMFSAVYCEVILILMIAQIQDIESIIKDFVAIGFIVEIDDQFYKNMKNNNNYDVEGLIAEFQQNDELQICSQSTYLHQIARKVNSCLGRDVEHTSQK